MSKESIFLNKQRIRRFFIYGLFFLASNLIHSVSFGAYKITTYRNCNFRLASFPIIMATPFKQVNTKDFAKAGYLYIGFTSSNYSLIKCFSCGCTVKAEADITCADLKNKHYDDCDYILLENQPLSITSLIELAPSEEQQPSTAASSDTPSNTSNEQGLTTVNADLTQNKTTKSADNEMQKSSTREMPDLTPIRELLSLVKKIAVKTEAIPAVTTEVLQEEVATSEDLQTVSTNEDLQSESSVEYAANALYEDLYKKMYITNKVIPDHRIKIWDTLHSHLKTSSPSLNLGVSFDMTSMDTSFPVIADTDPFSERCSYKSVTDLKDLFFCSPSHNNFTCLSLMLEIDRKTIKTITKINDSQHIALKNAFAQSPLFYIKDNGKKKGSRVGIQKKLSEIIKEDGTVIDSESLQKSDIGTLLYMSARRVLFENKVNILSISDLIHKISVMFCEKSILSRLSKSLYLTDNEYGHIKYDKNFIFPDLIAADSSYEAIPGIREIALLVSQHICIFYMWDLWGMLKNGQPIPEFVDPRKALEFISIENIKSFILEAAESVLSCSIGEMQKKIDKFNGGRYHDHALTKNYMNDYIRLIANNFKDSWSFSMDDDSYLRKIFPGSENSMIKAYEKEVDNAPVCIICHDTLKKGKTRMMGFSSCRHSMEEHCWNTYKDTHNKEKTSSILEWLVQLDVQNIDNEIKCPFCRTPIKDPTPYTYDGMPVRENITP